MLHEAIHEKTIVRNDNKASAEIEQEFLEAIQRDQIEVVCGLIEDEKVGIFDENHHESEAAALPAT